MSSLQLEQVLQHNTHTHRKWVSLVLRTHRGRLSVSIETPAVGDVEGTELGGSDSVMGVDTKEK